MPLEPLYLSPLSAYPCPSPPRPRPRPAPAPHPCAPQSAKKTPPKGKKSPSKKPAAKAKSVKKAIKKAKPGIFEKGGVSKADRDATAKKPKSKVMG